MPFENLYLVASKIDRMGLSYLIYTVFDREIRNGNSKFPWFPCQNAIAGTLLSTMPREVSNRTLNTEFESNYGFQVSDTGGSFWKKLWIKKWCTAKT